MPQTYTETVPARDVRRGDVDPITGVTVASVRVGTKYVTITNVEPGLPWKVALDKLIEVQRQRPTDEERAAILVQSTIEALDWTEHMDRQRFTKARTEAIAQLSAGRTPSWDLLEELPEVEARVSLWTRVGAQHRHMVQNGEDVTRLDVVAQVAADTIDTLLGGLRLGGSTSPASNLLADGRRAGEARWARDAQSAVSRITR